MDKRDDEMEQNEKTELTVRQKMLAYGIGVVVLAALAVYVFYLNSHEEPPPPPVTRAVLPTVDLRCSQEIAEQADIQNTQTRNNGGITPKTTPPLTPECEQFKMDRPGYFKPESSNKASEHKPS